MSPLDKAVEDAKSALTAIGAAELGAIADIGRGDRTAITRLAALDMQRTQITEAVNKPNGGRS